MIIDTLKVIWQTSEEEEDDDKEPYQYMCVRGLGFDLYAEEAYSEAMLLKAPRAWGEEQDKAYDRLLAEIIEQARECDIMYSKITVNGEAI